MKTNEQIELLNQMIQRAELDHSTQVDVYRKRLREQWTKIFKNDKQLEKDAENALNASEYMLEDDGLYTWFRVKINLEDYSDCKEYFEEWISDKYGLSVGWQHGCFMNYHGDDFISIQDDAGRGNGVWQNNKCIIDEQEYKNEDGSINEARRNELIENHMEKDGCFPGVFRVTRYGDVFHVNTQKPK